MNIFKQWLRKLKPRTPKSVTEASFIQDAAAVAKFLDQGADIETCDEEGITLLMNAVVFQDMATAQLLIARGARLDRRQRKGGRPCILLRRTMT